ncbi:hypothetical protein MTR_0317s0040 [Medicago truncatula]|uniref:Uncharacterized protein n=1 Tax=Medicago truncatula TaxID=3880 RepID=A0A072TEX9_MEDTR|nr:hypothetical protein MTR_0317s0040 [Medicago truncatula]
MNNGLEAVNVPAVYSCSNLKKLQVQHKEQKVICSVVLQHENEIKLKIKPQNSPAAVQTLNRSRKSILSEDATAQQLSSVAAALSGVRKLNPIYIYGEEDDSEDIMASRPQTSPPSLPSSPQI